MLGASSGYCGQAIKLNCACCSRNCVQINNADQTTINGILFADARWAPNGTTNPITDPIPPIATGSTPLITSDYLDLDAPNPLLYPEGMLLWNTRRSGFNVKSFQVNYLTQANYPTIPSWVAASAPSYDYPSQNDAWVTAVSYTHLTLPTIYSV